MAVVPALPSFLSRHFDGMDGVHKSLWLTQSWRLVVVGVLRTRGWGLAPWVWVCGRRWPVGWAWPMLTARRLTRRVLNRWVALAQQSTTVV
jgi:hypothetical protein